MVNLRNHPHHVNAFDGVCIETDCSKGKGFAMIN